MIVTEEYFIMKLDTSYFEFQYLDVRYFEKLFQTQ